MAADYQCMSDEELARETQGGSLAAFEELVYRYEGRIYGFVRQYCHCEADAAEITQDSFVRAFQAIGGFQPRGGFGSWLFTIARRKCIDRYRAAVRAGSVEAVPELPDHDDPSVLLARREERQGLWDLARRHLREVQYQALWLRYSEGMAVAEVARVLRKTQTHVKVLLFRARETLRGELQAAPATGLPTEKAADRARPARGEMLHRTGVEVARAGRDRCGGFAGPVLMRQPVTAKKGFL